MTQAAGAWTDRTQLEILRRLQIAKISGEKYFHPTNQISLQMWKTKLMKKDAFKTQSYDSPKHWWALSADIQICEETAQFSKFKKEKAKTPFTRTRISQLQPFAKDSSVHWFRTRGVSRFLTIMAGSQYSQYGKKYRPWTEPSISQLPDNRYGIGIGLAFASTVLWELNQQWLHLFLRNISE